MEINVLNQWKAIFWKEWRENLKWAALGFLGLAAALIYMISTATRGYIQPNFFNTWTNITQTFTLGAPLLGMALGFLQVLPELRRDQWAFLVHRPVSRSVIFFGKACAGLLLYFHATGFVLLCLIPWISNPKCLTAPYDPRLLLGSIASILMGTLFYFAAMLSAIRQARKYGSRAFGLLAAGGCGCIIVNVREFWQALIVIVIGCCFLAMAAWGSFLTSGFLSRQPTAGKVSLGISLFAANVMITLGLIAMGVTIIDIIRPPVNNSTSSYQVTKTGRIVKIIYRHSHLSIVDVQNPDGKTISNSPDALNDILPWTYVADLRELNWTPKYTNPERYVKTLNSYGDIQWYYVAAKRQLEAYSLADKKHIGYLGPMGLTAREQIVPQTAPRFGNILEAEPYNRYVLTNFGNVFYLIDPNKNMSKAMFTEQTGDPVYSEQMLPKFNGSGEDSIILIATGRYLIGFSAKGNRLFTHFWQYPVADYDLSATLSPNDNTVFYRYSPNVRSNRGQPLHQVIFVETTLRGKIIYQHSLPSLNNNFTKSPSYSQFLEMGALVPPLMLGSIYTYVICAHQHSANEFADYVWGQIAQQPHCWRMLLIGNLLGGVVCALLAIRIGRRAMLAHPALTVWATGVFCLGMPGVLLMLSMLEWPTQIDCANCGKKRSVKRDQCERCGNGWPIPNHDGTEILEDESALRMADGGRAAAL